MAYSVSIVHVSIFDILYWLVLQESDRILSWKLAMTLHVTWKVVVWAPVSWAHLIIFVFCCLHQRLRTSLSFNLLQMFALAAFIVIKTFIIIYYCEVDISYVLQSAQRRLLYGYPHLIKSLILSEEMWLLVVVVILTEWHTYEMQLKCVLRRTM